MTIIDQLNRDRINRELDQGFSPHLLALADLHEEQGDLWKAKAYRWLAERNKTPALGDDGRWGWYFARSEMNYGSKLPSQCRQYLLGYPGEIGCVEGESRTISGAYLLAATVVAQWLQRADA